MASQGTSELPLYVALYQQLRARVVDGTLPTGSRLPSARMLARDLAVSRNTVEAAYAKLQSEGFIERRVGAGTVVSREVQDRPLRPAVGVGAARVPARIDQRAVAAGSTSPGAATLSQRGALLAEHGSAELALDATSGPLLTDARRFPAAAWTRIASRHARRATGHTVLASDLQGRPNLREAIAEHARLTRGVECEASQVLVVNSAQQAIDLVGRVLLDPLDLALLEDPGYPAARRAFTALGATPVPIPVDESGLVTDALPQPAGRAVLYLTPSHQFPTGVTMSLARRLAALQWAEAPGRWILEDDYDSEYQYNGRPLAALQGLDRAERVIYMATWNKVLFPGLRLAYLIAPRALVPPLLAARRLTDGPANPMMQATLADFLRSGFLAAHLRHARQHYAALRDALERAIRRAWPPVVTLGPAATGLHLVAHLPEAVDDVALAAAVRGAHSLWIAPLSGYYVGPVEAKGLVIGYGTAALDTVDATIAALAPAVLQSVS